MVNKRNEKSSLDSATVVAQAIEAGGFVEFDTNRLLTGCSIEHAGGSNTVQLLTPGLYLVMFNGDLVADAASEVTVQMYNNNVALAGASTTIPAVAATDCLCSLATVAVQRYRWSFLGSASVFCLPQTQAETICPLVVQVASMVWL